MTGAPGATTRVAAILLAAGSSRRLGRAKQLLDWHGRPLVRHAASLLLASKASEVVAVLGHRARAVEQALAGLEIRVVVNRHWHEGQSTSVRAGVEAAQGRCDGALFAPCDQPFLTTETVDQLIELFSRDPRRIVRPRYGGRPGAPVIFPARHFELLRRLRGDEGGRSVLRRDRHELVELEVEDAREGQDLDTEDDVARFGL